MNNKNINKWTNSSRSAIVLQKTYGTPFYRLSRLQSLSGFPVAYSSLWQQYLDVWQEGGGAEIYGVLLEMAAECNSLNLDDTRARILEITIANKKLRTQNKKGRSCYTTTICAKTTNNEVIVLYFTGNKHGGENIGNVLKNRKNRTDSIQLMTDASNNNNPVLSEADKELLAIIVMINCLSHGQRKFTENELYYPEECGYFLKQTCGIYHNEHQCKEMSPEEKLGYHQEHSSKYIENIYNKIDELFNDKKVEPNSRLGQVMRYWLNNKEGLTQFLKIPVSSLDNNWAERSLRTIILQRKNSLFFKTINSAEIHSGLYSIVKTCSENEINAFKYLNWLQEQSSKAKKHPANYSPFAYARYMNNTELIKTAA
ncbi:IS66 family transposase [Candidatus Tisiphia endosymbiont of Micropterix aruncella]|uniref:IS66 family transposase n=1 Tax=Candidatus Tisiphia endosymbiont of Micropterix aruncella TaxID=3066271 RepID=UPI003AA918E7